MKKLLAIISMLSFLLLAACSNEAAQNEEHDSHSNETSTSEENNTSTKEDNNTAESVEEQLLTYQLNGKTIEETATLTNSDNQGFSMYVLPSFTLTGEEPGKDSLFLTDSDHNSMRIELLGDKPDWEQYEQNIESELEYLKSDITTPDAPSLQMDNATIYEASNDEDIVTIYLVKNKKQPMKLTIFTNTDEDYRSAFIEMAKTITITQ